MLKKIFFCFYFVLIVIISYSQTDTFLLDPVIVKSSFLSENQNLNQVDSFILLKNNNAQLSDLIKTTSSVFIKSYGNNGVSTASFRGTAASHTQVLWNNIPLNSAMLGQTDFSLIPVFFSDKIDIFAGNYSLNMSNGALGGIISLSTNNYLNKSFSFSLSQNFASFQNYGSFLKLYANYKKISFDTRVFFKSGKNNFQFFNNNIAVPQWQINKNSDFCQVAIFQKIEYKINSKNKFSAFFWITDTKRKISPIMTYEGLYRDENQTDNKHIASLNYNNTIEKAQLELSTSLIFNELNYFLADSVLSSPNNFLIIKNNSENQEISTYNYALLIYNISKKLSLKTKFSSNYLKVNSIDTATYMISGYKASRFENNLNFSLAYNINKRIKADFTFNETSINKKLYNPAFNFNISSEIIKDNKFVTGINAGKNLHFPTLNDLYWKPGGNENLKPETAYQFDFYILSDLQSKKILSKIKIAIFASVIDNWILWKPSEYNYWTAQNVRKVFSRGLEANYKLISKSKIVTKIILNYALTLTSDISYSNKFDILNTNQLVYIPKNTANLFIINNIKIFELSTDLSFTDKQYTNTSNDLFVLPSFFVFNMSILKSFTIKEYKLQFTFSLNNILNNQYQTILFRPMPGRNFEFKINLTF